MDLLEATEDRIVRKVDGTDCTFHFLTAYDRAELLRADLVRRQTAWRARRERVIENIKIAGLTPEQTFAELERFEDDTPDGTSLSMWIEFVNDVSNEVPIFIASLRPTHGGQAEELAKKSIVSIRDKAKLCGLIVPEESQAAKPVDPVANDPNALPPTYGS